MKDSDVFWFINKIARYHNGGSDCEDSRLNAELTHFNQPQCVRCTLLYLYLHDEWKTVSLAVRLMTP